MTQKETTDRKVLDELVNLNAMTSSEAELVSTIDHLRAVNMQLLSLAKNVVGFCVALREDKPCWRDHPDAGVLFAKATAAIKAATKE